MLCCFNSIFFNTFLHCGMNSTCISVSQSEKGTHPQFKLLTPSWFITENACFQYTSTPLFHFSPICGTAFPDCSIALFIQGLQVNSTTPTHVIPIYTRELSHFPKPYLTQQAYFEVTDPPLEVLLRGHRTLYLYCEKLSKYRLPK